MIKRRDAKQKRLMFVDLEDFVPANHILRLISSKVDFSFVYKLVKEL